MIARSSWAGLLLVVLVGCDRMNIDVYSCYFPDKGHKGPDGQPDPCHYQDTDGGTDGGADPQCDGTCVPVSPPEWSEPVLFWHGAPTDQPQCPSWAPARYARGVADLTSPPASCVACECQPPTGTCALPAAITVSNGPICTTPGNTWTSFDPPAGWAGECTQANAIPAGQLCGGIPCVQSVSIGPLVLTETGCIPTVTSPPAPPPGPGGAQDWTTAGVTCGSNHNGQCSNPGETCAPNLPPPPPGFQVCISAILDRECFEPFPQKYLTYRSRNDGRTCTPCACDAPSGSMCTGAISIFNDSGCGTTPLVTLTAVNGGPTCGQVPAGSGLLSKKSEGLLTYTAGVCQPSGGEPTGADELVESTTFCCRP